jgi:hypothetical protein
MGEGEGDNPKANVDAYVIENNGIDLQRPGISEEPECNTTEVPDIAE